MRPKTKLQKKLVKLSNSLKPISDAQMKYAEKHALDHLCFINKTGLHSCMDCGHSWRGETIAVQDKWKRDIVKSYEKCPNCKEKLQQIATQERTTDDYATFGIMTVCKGYQLFRMWVFKSHAKTKTKKRVWCYEVGQIWLCEDGRHEYIGMNRSGYNNNFWGGMEIRNRNNAFYVSEPYCFYSRQKILQRVYRNGFKGDFMGIKPFDFFKAILNSNIAETLLKTRRLELFKKYVNQRYFADNLEKYWMSLKIAWRHKYKIKNYSDYFDFLNFLKADGKDLRNPKVICPKDLSEAHQFYVKRELKRREIEREREKRIRDLERLRMLKITAKDYRVRMEPFKSLKFVIPEFENVVIKPLKTIKEVEKAGKELVHCIYVQDYHKKKHRLLLGAYSGKKIIETTEVNLITFEVEQSRGYDNLDTEYTPYIVETVNNKMKLIKRAYSKRKTIQKQSA